MANIELTDTQRQVLEQERGRPVTVMDPATQEHYVLLARDLYERVRDLRTSHLPPAFPLDLQMIDGGPSR